MGKPKYLQLLEGKLVYRNQNYPWITKVNFFTLNDPSQTTDISKIDPSLKNVEAKKNGKKQFWLNFQIKINVPFLIVQC